MFKVFINDGKEEIPDDDIFYIVSKEGIFLKKKTGIINSVMPVDKISILKDINFINQASIDIPKIGSEDFAKIASFFREVYKQFSGECIALVYFNEKLKKFKFVIPIQEVSHANLSYKTENISNYNLIGDIHSHANMSAFHSGTDDADEKEFDGLHITLGNVNTENISISASIVVNGNRVMIEPEDYIYGIKKAPVKKPNDENLMRNGAMFDFGSNYYNFNNSYNDTNKYLIEVSEQKSKFNPEWLSKVSKFAPIATNHKIDNKNYITNLKNLFSKNYTKSFHKKYDPQLLDIKSPCENCIYRDCKVDLMIEDLESEKVDETDWWWDDNQEYNDELLKGNF